MKRLVNFKKRLANNRLKIWKQEVGGLVNIPRYLYRWGQKKSVKEYPGKLNCTWIDELILQTTEN